MRVVCGVIMEPPPLTTYPHSQQNSDCEGDSVGSLRQFDKEVRERGDSLRKLRNKIWKYCKTFTYCCRLIPVNRLTKKIKSRVVLPTRKISKKSKEWPRKAFKLIVRKENLRSRVYAWCYLCLTTLKNLRFLWILFLIYIFLLSTIFVWTVSHFSTHLEIYACHALRYGFQPLYKVSNILMYFELMNYCTNILFKSLDRINFHESLSAILDSSNTEERMGSDFIKRSAYRSDFINRHLLSRRVRIRVCTASNFHSLADY
jgi:hypothetical protein